VARPEVTGRRTSAPKKKNDKWQRFHLDRRADQIADAAKGPADDLLTTREIAYWFGVSEQWVTLGQRENYGPPYVRPYPEIIRYKRGEAIKWLRGRARLVANEYA